MSWDFKMKVLKNGTCEKSFIEDATSLQSRGCNCQRNNIAEDQPIIILLAI